MGFPTPIMVYPGTTNQIRASDRTGLLSFTYGQGVQLACPGSSNYLYALGLGNQEAVAYCIGGNSFSIDNVTYSYNQFSCAMVIYSTKFLDKFISI